MTRGAVLERDRAQPRPPSHERRWIDGPTIATYLPTLLAVVVFAGCFLRIRQRWFIPGFSGFGYTTWVVQSTVDGTAIAPNQYRPLMPWVMHLVSVASGLPLPTGILVCDAVVLAAAVAVLHRLSVLLDARWLILVAAAGWAWFLVKIDHWHPEITLLTLVAAIAALVLLDARPRWWSIGLLTLAGLLACGARTDYAAGLSLVMFGVALARRRFLLGVAGLVVGTAAMVSTVVLADVLYPQAYYRVALVQADYNLSPGSLAFVATFYGPLVALPALAAWRLRRAPLLAPVVVWFVVELAAVFVVGRVEESRIVLPFAPVLAMAAALAYRDLTGRAT